MCVYIYIYIHMYHVYLDRGLRTRRDAEHDAARPRRLETLEAPPLLTAWPAPPSPGARRPASRAARAQRCPERVATGKAAA